MPRQRSTGSRTRRRRSPGFKAEAPRGGTGRTRTYDQGIMSPIDATKIGASVAATHRQSAIAVSVSGGDFTCLTPVESFRPE